MLLNEQAISKIENLATKALDAPIDATGHVINTPVEQFQKLPLGKRIVKALEEDPTKLSKKQNAKEWATLLGAGSLITHTPMFVLGDIVTPLAVAAGNATKGAIIGPLMSKGEDTLLRSAAVPAGIVAITTPVINAIGNHLGTEDNIDFMPEARVGLTAGLGAGLWAFRNRRKSNRKYI